MDTGTAPTSGYVSIYAIAGVSGTSILATAVSNSAGTIYAGSNMPTGYTASCLLSVWPTDGSNRLVVGKQNGRSVYIAPVLVLNGSSSQQASLTSLSLSSAIPSSASQVRGYIGINSTSGASTNCIVTLAGSAGGVGQQIVANFQGGVYGAFGVPVITAQTIYYTAQCSSGTMSLSIDVTGYNF